MAKKTARAGKGPDDPVSETEYSKYSEIFSNVWQDEGCIPFKVEGVADRKLELTYTKLWQNHVLWKNIPTGFYQISDLKVLACNLMGVGHPSFKDDKEVVKSLIVNQYYNPTNSKTLTSEQMAQYPWA